MKALITGVSGFVGRQLAGHLISEGWEVDGVDLRELELPFAQNPLFRFYPMDITETTQIEQLPWESVDVLYHLAAAGVKVATRQWPLCVQVNLVGTAAIMGVLMQRVHENKKVPRIVYTKSYYEDHVDKIPAFKDNAYVVSKVAATRWLQALASVYPQSITIAKVFQVYGPGDDPANVLNYAAHTLKTGNKAIFGSGKSMRDWIYIEDFIHGLLACTNSVHSGYKQYDIGSGERHSIREMVEVIAGITGAKHDCLVFDPSKDRGDTEIEDWATCPPEGWSAQCSIRDGIQSLIKSV